MKGKKHYPRVIHHYPYYGYPYHGYYRYPYGYDYGYREPPTYIIHQDKDDNQVWGLPKIHWPTLLATLAVGILLWGFK